MAHEIRTPLGIIRNAAQLLERRMLAAGDAEAGEWAVFIREESDRLARVVTDLLDYVRPSEPKKSKVDLDALVRRIVGFLGSEAAKRGVRLELEAVPVPVEVACDADQIHQVCLNLIMNAIQACPRGGWVRIFTRRDDGEARLVVRDNGHGIPAEMVGRLFEPFATRSEGGIGLGLAIVRRIVRGHGGEVTARNLAEGGAEFVVVLPVVAVADDESFARPSGAAPNPDSTSIPGARIIS
jgi:two-component system sensor histidine kinase HydH